MDQKTDDTIPHIALDRPRPDAPPETAPGEPAGTPPQPRKRRRFWRMFGFLLLVAAGIGLYLHYRPTEQAPAPSAQHHRPNPADVPQPVGVANVVTGDIPVTFDALGTVTSLQTVTIMSQISGYLQSVNFKEGQYVKKGDFLAQIDPRPYEALEQQYEGQLAHDQGLLDQAKMDLARYQNLAQRDSIAKQTAEDQIYIVQQYEGSVKTDQALIQQQKVNLIYCHITSPVTGRIGLRQVDPGNYVTPTSTTGIAVATQLDPISVVFIVPEDLLPSINEEFKAGHELKTVAYDRSNTNELATGHVYALDSAIDTTTGTLKLKAEFANPDNKLFPNQFVNVRLLIRTLKNVTIAPSAAIQRGAPGTYVYLVEGDKVAVRKVTVGMIEGDKAMITSGLTAGDRVVIDGTDHLRDGAPITIPNASQAENAPQPPQPPQPGGTAAGEHKHQRKTAPSNNP